jgi:hypothetical protein
MGRWCVLPREALLSCRRGLPATTANRLDEETPKREGTEGGRFTGSTDDLGPMKPGNSVEEKTLTIRKRKTISPGLTLSRASMREGKPWTKGGCDSTAESTQCGEEGPEIKWGRRISQEMPRWEHITVSRHPVQVMRPQAARQSTV